MQSQKQLDNLIPGAHKLTAEEVKKGGEKSVEVRRKKRSLREAADLFNSMKPKETDIDTVVSELGEVSPEDIDRQMAVIAKLYKMAMSGNVKAMKLYIELSDDDSHDRKQLENEKLRAEVEELRREAEDDNEDIIVNIEIKDCKR